MKYLIFNENIEELISIFFEMKLLAFLHIAAVVGLQNLDAVYVWGSKYLSDDELKELTAADKAEMSFIRVGNRGSTLVIDSVQRGSDWSASKSFCSLLLPAVIRDYIESRRIDFESEIMRIKVINAATPRVAGCKCYARTMIEFGFSSINGKRLDRMTSSAPVLQGQ